MGLNFGHIRYICIYVNIYVCMCLYMCVYVYVSMCIQAGHVLGACMFGIEIAGRKILYTGDYTTKQVLIYLYICIHLHTYTSTHLHIYIHTYTSTHTSTYMQDRHLIPAEIPLFTPDVLIIESTFGTQTHDTVENREKRITRQQMYRCIDVFVLVCGYIYVYMCVSVFKQMCVY